MLRYAENQNLDHAGTSRRSRPTPSPAEDADVLILDADPMNYGAYIKIALADAKVVCEKDEQPFYRHARTGPAIRQTIEVQLRVGATQQMTSAPRRPGTGESLKR